MIFYAIRGAITVDRNERPEILSKTRLLLSTIIEKNSLKLNDIVSIILTGTKDITAVYPAVAARELGMTDIPLICIQEMNIDNSLPLCIRVMMHIQLLTSFHPKHIYLEKAVVLRPDLLLGNSGTTKYSIAIDGPAGAGKSTIARMLAQRLNILYVDTGAMYRAIALKIIEMDGNPENKSDVVPFLADTDVKILYNKGTQIVYLDGKDVTDRIRTQQISKAASAIAVIPEVRYKLVELQRKIANECSLVMDGRDIGTHVLPNADRKIFLTASVEERARRRWSELKQNGSEQDYSLILQDIIDRDNNDCNRSISPLRKAEDAVLVDTTGKSIEDVIEEIQRLI